MFIQRVAVVAFYAIYVTMCMLPRAACTHCAPLNGLPNLLKKRLLTMASQLQPSQPPLAHYALTFAVTHAEFGL
jgi:hypothetical protein